MTEDVVAALRSSINERVLAHIEPKSAHSDIAETITEAVKPLGEVQVICPSWQQSRYVAVSTRGIIFGFAIGMETIAFRLDARMKGRALVTGGEAYPATGDDWVSFIPFRDDWPKVDLRFWALKAYVYAREAKAGT